LLAHTSQKKWFNFLSLKHLVLNAFSKELVMEERIEILLQENLAVQKEILIELRAKNEIKQIDSYCSWRRCGICTVISIIIIIASGLGAAFGTARK
jgi:hypothetical protein